MAWGCAQYIKELPYANAAYNYNFKPGEPGKLTLEFWITPFDYAGCEGPQRAVESVLTENKLIGLAWAILDYDDASSEKHAFWNLSRQHTMYGKADELVAFRLMPLEPEFRKFEAKWSFGDGSSSTDQNPIHQYAKGADYTVTLEVEGAEGRSSREKIWDVAVK